MNLETLKEIKPSRFNNGKPSPTLTDKEWQHQFLAMKLYITPYNKSVTRMGGKFSRESGKEYENNEYDGTTNWQSYYSYVNDVLKNIRAGKHDFCYYGYQIVDLLKFHMNNLKTKYCDGYWEVWLER
ncbi:MAG: hypothetical protein IJA10_10550 [Lachnospiraceae bacterium]|nr:hypothetical protein [Lachnospiraceae bacterium]